MIKNKGIEILTEYTRYRNDETYINLDPVQRINDIAERLAKEYQLSAKRIGRMISWYENGGENKLVSRITCQIIGMMKQGPSEDELIERSAKLLTGIPDVDAEICEHFHSLSLLKYAFSKR